ncbi:formate dehydrogenase subunit delta [Marinobacter adhaerens]|nr:MULTISPECIES: formate dehydrogenase subunit delta [Marinobacter]
MSSDQTTHLVKMVNQISINAPTQCREEAIQFVAQHLTKFWAREMKRQIKEYAISDGEALSPISLQAVKML